MVTQSTFICPNCKKKISVDEALQSQIKDQLEQGLRDEFNKKWLEQREKDKQKSEEEKAQLELLLKKQESQLDEAHKFELELRNRARELEEKEKNLELEKQRQIDEERKKIQEKTEAEVTEKFHLKEKEHEQQMEAMKRSLEEAQRRASVGSQQLQGEVMELELEEMLKHEFPIDEVLPVAKGVSGADVIQRIRDSSGRDCGVIIWESKRTKEWKEDWIQKLKDNQRAAKADAAIIISSVLPNGVKNFEARQGVYIVNFDVFMGLAKLVRLGLIELHKTKFSTVNKNSKMEVVYEYLSGNEFRQRFEAIVETFVGMKKDLDKERQVYTGLWAKREKQIQKVVDNSVGMYGDLQGLMGTSLPEIKNLEPESLLIGTEEENDRG